MSNRFPSTKWAKFWEISDRFYELCMENELSMPKYGMLKRLLVGGRATQRVAILFSSWSVTYWLLSTALVFVLNDALLLYVVTYTVSNEDRKLMCCWHFDDFVSSGSAHSYVALVRWAVVYCITSPHRWNATVYGIRNLGCESWTWIWERRSKGKRFDG